MNDMMMMLTVVVVSISSAPPCNLVLPLHPIHAHTNPLAHHHPNKSRRNAFNHKLQISPNTQPPLPRVSRGLVRTMNKRKTQRPTQHKTQQPIKHLLTPHIQITPKIPCRALCTGIGGRVSDDGEGDEDISDDVKEEALPC